MRTSRLIRVVLAIGTVSLATLTGRAARAQFANHSIGLEGGFVYVANPAWQHVGSGGDIGLNSTLYIENGFDLYFRLLFGIHRQQETDKNVVGVFPAVGFRYLFSEDFFRPYLGLNIAYLYFAADNTPTQFAVSPMAGFEYFVSYNLSVGLQGEYHLILSLNDSPEHAAILIGKVSWYF